VGDETYRAFQVTVPRNQGNMTINSIEFDIKLETVAYASQLTYLKYIFSGISVIVLYFYWKTVRDKSSIILDQELLA
jgi:hypothetical protein